MPVTLLRVLSVNRGRILTCIFEELIPLDERRKLGQYFTPAHVVDLILGFCLQEKGDLVLDPGCGPGIFLERAYWYKRAADGDLRHDEILSTLWGVEIAESAVEAATVRLRALQGAGTESHPRIVWGDFFDQEPGGDADDGGLPHPLDCIVGNPPYTRQEWMAKAEGEDGSQEREGYKERLIRRATRDRSGRRIASISKRAGLQVYFFTHGTKFLRDGGRFGFVVSNSWLDVDYGQGLQEFLLGNYKLVALIESRVERWFADADINTCIVILEKCANRRERDANRVRFVQLKQPLGNLFPDAGDGWREWAPRLRRIDALVERITNTETRYSDDVMRIYPIAQRELWAAGGDMKSGRYAGSKWGKFLRAPDVYFDVLERSRGRLVPLSEVADVRFGIKTGANDFFYLKEEEVARWGIEPQYLRPVVKSPRECKSIRVQPGDLALSVLLVHEAKAQLAGTKVLRYIEFGESRGYHRRRTCASRARWYDLGQREPGPILWGMIHYKRHLAPLNAHAFQVDHNLFEILPRDGMGVKTLCALLNSTFANLVRELVGRTTLGQGALKTEGVDIAQVWVPDPRRLSASQVEALGVAFDALAGRPVGPISEELQRPDRRALDAVVFDILGLATREREAIYGAVVDLVRARVERARSVARG